MSRESDNAIARMKKIGAMSPEQQTAYLKLEKKYGGLNGVGLIAQERARQLCAEGYTLERDDGYQQDELIMAAMCYMAAASKYETGADVTWPWDAESFKHTTPIRNLVKAGALIAAEIDRLERLPAGKGESPNTKL